MVGNTERITSVTVQFQYKGPKDARPKDYGQTADLNFEVPYGTPPATVPIPAVGDTVTMELTDADKCAAYKVITRHFYYSESETALFISINIVVTDVNSEEMAARLKQWQVAADSAFLSVGLSVQDNPTVNHRTIDRARRASPQFVDNGGRQL